jgi:Tol biopolymer transport system component
MCNRYGWMLVVVIVCALPAVTIGQGGTTERVSVDSSGMEANGETNGRLSISADGRYVVFDSDANNLVAEDANGASDVFVRDRQTGTTERVSVDSAGVEGNLESRGPSISADGRFVAFYSAATNLITGDTNGATDIFVHDRQTGTSERVSLDSGGVEGNLESLGPSISADGRFVAFYSAATNLIAEDTNGVSDVFVHDRLTDTTERVSVHSAGVQGDDASGMQSAPSISADGRFVAFVSTATNLVEDDTNGFDDVFVHDRQTGATERVSVDSDGAEGNRDSGENGTVAISADGRFVAFASGANLVAGDTYPPTDIFLRDRLMGTTERVSVDSTGTEGNSSSRHPSISADGRYVVFDSTATNLVAGDTNARHDVFVHDRLMGTTERVSVSSGGLEGDDASRFHSISADGRLVAFESEATNLVEEDTNGVRDVFVRDRGPADDDADGVLDADDNCPMTANADQADMDGDGVGDACDVNPDDGPTGDQDGDGIANNVDNCWLSANTDQTDGDGDGVGDACDPNPYDGPTGDLDGDSVLNNADNCSQTPNADQADADGDGVGDACDVNLGTTERVSIDNAGVEGDDDSTLPSISADGRFVAFRSNATDLVPEDTNGVRDIFVRDRQTGATRRVSVDSAGVEGNGDPDEPAMSADGRFVAFASSATNLVAADANATSDVFVHDLQMGVTERVSVANGGAEADSGSNDASISADGRFVAFASGATNLVAGDTNGVSDIFVRDRQTGTTERVSVDSSGLESDASGTSPSISADGRFVAFDSLATNLVTADTNGVYDIFVRDRQTGTTERVSIDSAGLAGNDRSIFPSISADGRFVSFDSRASNLVMGDTNGREDVFVHDRYNGMTERVNVDSAGTQANGGARGYTFAMSANGRFVAFESGATNLVAGDTNGVSDIFVRDRLTGTTERVSVASAGTEGDGGSNEASISADGRFVAFESRATNLAAADTNGVSDIFVRNRVSNTPTGSNVDVTPVDTTTGTSPVLLTFGEVTTPGSTSLATSTDGPSPPTGFALGDPATYYNLTTTAVFTPPASVCIDYSGVSYQDETQLRLWHLEAGAWADQTSSLDTGTNIICAVVNSLSPFVVLEPDSVDTTSPILSVSLSPSVLWPLNHNLVAVAASIQVSDDSDPSPTVTLVSIVSDEADSGGGNGGQPNDVQDAAVGTDDRAFSLRAERDGNGDGRVYTITYRATDAAGNQTLATATVTTPHDQGR